MIQLVACDIDGTLLHGDQTEISSAVFEQISRLSQLGVRFCPASGRQYSSLRRLFAPVADQLYYLCENGAVVYGPGDPGTVLAKVPMHRDQALALCQEILQTDQCEVLISGADTSYLCPKCADIVDHIRYFVGNRVAVLDSPRDVPEEIVKVSAYCRPGTAHAASALLPRWQDTFQVAIAGEKWLDFTAADKGIGLSVLCRALGVGLDRVMAFGDNENDLPMLHRAGVPYIMENAPEYLRSQFPNHCRRVEDVLARML